MKDTKNFLLRSLASLFGVAIWNSILFAQILSEPAFAFDLDFSGGGGSYGFRTPVYDDGIYRVWVERHRMQKLPVGGTRRFNNVLTNHASGNYLFRKSSRSLEGKFEIHHYYPCNIGQPCGAELNLNPRTDGVGASLDLSYVPRPITPDPDLPILPSTLHWIQMYRSTGSVNQPVGVIDTTDHPIYYSSLTSSNPSFSDTPYRVPYTIPQRWIAELYLAEVVGQNPQGQTIVEIWDGVRWGFRSRVLRRKPSPEPQPVPLPLPFPFPELDPRRIPVQCTGGSGGGGCDQYDPIPTIAGGIKYGNPYWFLNSAYSRLWFGIGNQFANLPPRRYGFEFEAVGDTLFESILSLPIDMDDDDLFTVSVDGTVLGDFDTSETIDFVSLLGSGVSNFRVTNIDPLFGTVIDPQFPIQLSFVDDIGGFTARALDCSLSSGYSGGGGFGSGYSGGGGVGCEPYSGASASGFSLLNSASPVTSRTKPIPEPSTIFGLVVFTILSGLGIISCRNRQP
ncbi:hypothetical protein HC928_13470 [bacterium]|nr:hypothetical protein [bacterium]